MYDIVLLVDFVLLDFVVVGFELHDFKPVGRSVLGLFLGVDELSEDCLLLCLLSQLFRRDVIVFVLLFSFPLQIGDSVLHRVERFELVHLL